MIMSRLDELKAKGSALSTERENTIAGVSEVPKELLRVADVAHNAEQNIKNLDEEFELQTKLRGKDIGFLFFATALQCVRQYILTDFKERLSDQEAAKNTKGHTKDIHLEHIVFIILLLKKLLQIQYHLILRLEHQASEVILQNMEDIDIPH